MNDILFGLQITVIGMGLVFALLALLWGLLALAGRLEMRGQRRRAVAPSPPAPLSQPASATPLEVRVSGPGAEGLEPAALAAITAAVLAHAANRRRQAAPETRSHWPGSLLFASRWVASGRARQTRGYERGRR